MSRIVHTVARLLASETGKAVRIRSAYALAPDPRSRFAIVPLRMVAEQTVYAIAYGDPDGEPELVLTPTPLNREARFLEPFAVALDAYLTMMVDAGQLPRIWLPHAAALEVVELLGHRYRNNKNAGPLLQRMGRLCSILADEATFAGQQVVAVAAEQLAAHAVTGQSPSEDRHLGALLAWIDPPAGETAAEAAALAVLEPAAAMLAREVDDRVEQLNSAVREENLARTAANAAIEPLLRAEAQREWRLMAWARRAFWSLGLEHNEQIAELVEESLDRVAYRIAPSDGRTAGRGTIAARLDAQVYAQELAEYVDVEVDRVVRAQARRAGRVFQGRVLEREQPRPGYHPCTLRIVAEQDVLRVRRGSVLQLRESGVRGRVEAVTTDGDGRVVLTLVVQSGVRDAAHIVRGDATELSDPAPADLRFPKNKIYRRMNATQDPRVYASALPGGTPLHAGDDLLAVARKLRSC